MTISEINKAIEIAGSQKALADQIGASQQNVAYWKKYRVPAEWVRPICEAVDHRITPADLRPDLYESAA